MPKKSIKKTAPSVSTFVFGKKQKVAAPKKKVDYYYKLLLNPEREKNRYEFLYRLLPYSKYLTDEQKSAKQLIIKKYEKDTSGSESLFLNLFVNVVGSDLEDFLKIFEETVKKNDYKYVKTLSKKETFSPLTHLLTEYISKLPKTHPLVKKYTSFINREKTNLENTIQQQEEKFKEIEQQLFQEQKEVEESKKEDEPIHVGQILESKYEEGDIEEEIVFEDVVDEEDPDDYIDYEIDEKKIDIDEDIETNVILEEEEKMDISKLEKLMKRDEEVVITEEDDDIDIGYNEVKELFIMGKSKYKKEHDEFYFNKYSELLDNDYYKNADSDTMSAEKRRYILLSLIYKSSNNDAVREYNELYSADIELLRYIKSFSIDRINNIIENFKLFITNPQNNEFIENMMASRNSLILYFFRKWSQQLIDSKEDNSTFIRLQNIPFIERISIIPYEQDTKDYIAKYNDMLDIPLTDSKDKRRYILLKLLKSSIRSQYLEHIKEYDVLFPEDSYFTDLVLSLPMRRIRYIYDKILSNYTDYDTDESMVIYFIKKELEHMVELVNEFIEYRDRSKNYLKNILMEKVKKFQNKKDIQVIVPPQYKKLFKKLVGRKQLRIHLDKKGVQLFGIDRMVLDLQISKPWIENYDSTWLMSPTDVELIKNYIIQGENIEYKNNIYHRANKLYHILESSYYSRKLSSQNDNILRLYESKDKYVDFIVLHKLDDTGSGSNSFILQTENLYQKQIEYIKNKKLNDQNYIENILNTEIKKSGKMLKISQMLIRNAITSRIDKIASQHNITSEELLELTSYSITIAESIYNQDYNKFRDLFRKTSEFLVFIDNRMLQKYTQLFQEKLVKRIYKPEMIKDLNNNDKFYELYKNDESVIINTVNQRIEYYINLMNEEFAEKLHSILNTIVYRPRHKEIINIKSLIDNLDLDVRSICENKDVGDDMWQYVIYEEDYKKYCIHMDMIGDKNPYTGNPYSDVFLNNMKKINMTTKYEDVSTAQTELTPNLLEFVIRDLVKREEYLSVSTIPIETKCEYCHNHLDENNSLRTIIKYNEDSKIVEFCKISCFEKWNPPSIKKTMV